MDRLSRRRRHALAHLELPFDLGEALVGYAGWAPSQLEHEIARGAWLPSKLEPSLVFDVPAERLWQAAYERVGVTPMAFTSRTVGSA